MGRSPLDRRSAPLHRLLPGLEQKQRFCRLVVKQICVVAVLDLTTKHTADERNTTAYGQAGGTHLYAYSKYIMPLFGPNMKQTRIVTILITILYSSTHYFHPPLLPLYGEGEKKRKNETNCGAKRKKYGIAFVERVRIGTGVLSLQ